MNGSRVMWALPLVGALSFAACDKGEPFTPPDCRENARVVGRVLQEDGSFRYPDYLIQTIAVVWNMEYEVNDVTIVEGFHPIRLLVPDDVTSIGITLQSEDANPVLTEIRAEGETFFGLNPTQLPLTKASTTWPSAVSIVLPNNEKTSVTGKCVEVWVAATDTTAEDRAELFVTSRRGEGAQLNLHFVIADEVALDEETLDAVVARTARYFEGAFTLGTPTVERLPMDAIQDLREQSVHELAAYLPDDINRLQVLVVDELIGDDGSSVRFFSPGLPGTPFLGLNTSSIRLALSEHLNADGTALSTDFLGDSLARAITQMFGLFHVTEASGKDVDPIGDTPQCLASEYDRDQNGVVSPAECAQAGADNLMFWTATPGIGLRLSAQQNAVLRNHPVVLAEGEIR